MSEVKGLDLIKKWEPVLESSDAPAIKGFHQKLMMAQLLENQHSANRTESTILSEATPTNVTGGVARWDPILISMVRRSAPQLIANDIIGVQAMSGPTGLIFAMKARYTNQAGPEALFNAADSAFSGRSSDGTAGHTTPVAADTAGDPFSVGFTAGNGHTTAQGEGDIIAEMAFTVDKIAVEAKTRSLKGNYSVEMAQDLRALHNLDADAEMSTMMTTELTAEMNREIIRKLYKVAKLGAANTAVAGTFNLNVDSDGRWLVEKFKGLMYQVDRDSNQIFLETRRGRGNFIIASLDVVSALANAGLLDYSSAISGNKDLTQDFENGTFVGMLQGRYRVYTDPYITGNVVLVGYKGLDPKDAGLFFAPYVPFQMYRAVDEASMQPIMAFKTRYGLVANPFVLNGGGTPDAEAMTARRNQYYRVFAVSNL